MMTEESAKDFLRDQGYFVDNLWQVADVQGNFKVSDQEAQEILGNVLEGEFHISSVFEAIDDACVFAEYKRIPNQE